MAGRAQASDEEMAAIARQMARRRAAAVRSTLANGMAVMLGYIAVYACTIFSVLLIFELPPNDAALFGGSLGITMGLSKATKTYAKAQ